MRRAVFGMMAIVVFAILGMCLLHDRSRPADSDLQALGVVSASLEASQPQPIGDPKSPNASPPGGPPGGFRFPAPPLVDVLDANHDGELDADEIAKAASRLKSLDKNGDGELSEDEHETRFPRGPGGPGGPVGPGPGGGGGPGAPGFGGPGLRRTVELSSRFDEDKDGMLNQEERTKARAFLKEQGAARGGMFGHGPGGPFGGRGPGGAEDASAQKPGRHLSPKDVAQYPDAGLYDPHVLRTLFFEFDGKDWEQELEDFRGTDVEVPAQLTVDGKTYPNVGLRFRGNTSMNTVSRGKRRPLNVSIDLVDKKQRLLGYRTLNLLNAHSDPSLLRTVLFDHISGHYLPAPKANLVRVVFNGECWGVYVNEQQFNRDFAEEWFGEKDGVRCKVPVNFSGAAALVYHGEDEETYRRLYQLKAKNEKQARRDLIGLCRQIEQLPDDRLEADLDRVLNIDRALWFLALDNVLMDDDGYISRGSDYCLYEDCTFGRFHLVARDSNETFRFGGGPGGPGGPGGGPGGPNGALGGPGPFGGFGGFGDLGPFGMFGGFGPPGSPAGADAPAAKKTGGAGQTDSKTQAGGASRRARAGFGGGPGGPGARESGATLDPLSMADSKVRPVIRRLLSNPNLRARYLAHVRTIVDEWLDWKTLGPVFEDYRALIAEDVLADTRNPSTFAEFFDADTEESSGGGPFGSPPGVKRFVDARRAYLLKHAELSKPRPTILAVERPGAVEASKPVAVVAQIGNDVPVATVLLYYAEGRGAPFAKIEMQRTSGKAGAAPGALSYSAEIPGTPEGAGVYYYVEARAERSLGTTAFSPRRTELGAIHYRTEASPGASSAPSRRPALVLNEIMASNTRTVRSPQGKFEDWIELANVGKEEANLSGMHLTNDMRMPHRYTFPPGTTLAGGQHLVVWADHESKANQDLHTGFKLSRKGDAVLLVDSEARGGTILDAVKFGPQRSDVSYGRYPDGTGAWRLLPPSPGKPNTDP